MSDEKSLTTQRQVTIFPTVGQKGQVITLDGDTFADLKAAMSKNNIQFDDNSMKAVIGETRNTLEANSALLPNMSSFSLFLFPKKTKSGAVAKKAAPKKAPAKKAPAKKAAEKKAPAKKTATKKETVSKKAAPKKAAIKKAPIENAAKASARKIKDAVNNNESDLDIIKNCIDKLEKVKQYNTVFAIKELKSIIGESKELGLTADKLRGEFKDVR